MRVYLLPGVGCDGRLFQRLQLQGHETIALSWPEFTPNDSLARIAERMLPQVRTDMPHVLLGVSMGGMVAQELALITRPEKVILISSWTGPTEWPPFVRVSAVLGLNRTIREWSMRAVWPLKRLVDPRERSIDELLFSMAKDQSARQLRLGTGAIMRWQGSRWDGPLVRIHGNKDLVTPLRFPVDHLIEGGQHVLVLTRANEVSRILMHELAH